MSQSRLFSRRELSILKTSWHVACQADNRNPAAHLRPCYRLQHRDRLGDYFIVCGMNTMGTLFGMAGRGGRSPTLAFMSGAKAECDYRRAKTYMAPHDLTLADLHNGYVASWFAARQADRPAVRRVA